MKQIVSLLTVLFILGQCGAAIPAQGSQDIAQNNNQRGIRATPSTEYLLNNGAQGREFWLCVPQNDRMQGNITIYVASRIPTNVRLTIAGQRVEKSITRPLQSIVFSSPEVVLSDVEMSRPATVTRQGVHIESDEPVSVYVLNNANASADGFLAIPLEALGKKYIHCGYYDHSEFSPGWGGQAGIVATEDNTVVRISLRGVGDAHPSSFLHGTQTRIDPRYFIENNPT